LRESAGALRNYAGLGARLDYALLCSDSTAPCGTRGALQQDSATGQKKRHRPTVKEASPDCKGGICFFAWLCGALRGSALPIMTLRRSAALCGALRGLCGTMRGSAGLCGTLRYMRDSAGLCGTLRFQLYDVATEHSHFFRKNTAMATNKARPGDFVRHCYGSFFAAASREFKRGSAQLARQRVIVTRGAQPRARRNRRRGEKRHVFRLADVRDAASSTGHSSLKKAASLQLPGLLYRPLGVSETILGPI
jgi:hypothetical protein